MIDVWAKIMRRAEGDQYVLRHLDYWLAEFSDKNKYNIIIYNENFDLPSSYNNYTTINTNELLKIEECKNWYDIIYNSKISNSGGKNWKKTAFVLTIPYIYLKSKYVLNADADDVKFTGSISGYVDIALYMMKKFNYPTLSYDYIFSHNPYDDRGIMPNHWSFGLNISNRERVKDIIIAAINSIDDFIRDKGNLYREDELNIDILMSYFLLKTDLKYLAFIAPMTIIHQEEIKSCYDPDTKQFHIISPKTNLYLNGCDVFKDIHPKTIILNQSL